MRTPNSSVFVIAFVFLVSCGESSVRNDGGASPDGSSGACADRQGGAFIQLQSATDIGESISLWGEDDTFIDEAIERAANGSFCVANFLEVTAGEECDGDHPWGMDPNNWACPENLDVQCLDRQAARLTARLDSYSIGLS